MGSIKTIRIPYQILIWALCLHPFLQPALALSDDQIVTHSNQIDTNTSDLLIQQSQIKDAKKWGLTLDEWRKYQSLMEGQRGIWSPNLDPITALGVEAETDQERMRYARLLVEVEKRRVEQEIAFQQAYDAAFREMYPDLMAVNTFFTREESKTANQITQLESRIAQSPLERISVVVADNCAACDAIINKLVNLHAAVDIYIANAQDDTEIRRWAVRMNIPVDRVRARHITLNHYRGDGVDPEQLPIVVEQGR